MYKIISLFRTSATAASKLPLLQALKCIGIVVFLIGKAALLTSWFAAKTMFLYFWRHPVHGILNIGLLIVIGVMLTTGTQLHQQLLLSQISDQTIDQIIEGSRFTRDFNSVELARGNSREFLRAGAPVWMQRESVRAILFYARQANLPIEDQAVLLATADIESGFNPTAHAGITSACGLFQFVKATGMAFELRPEKCMNPWANARAGVLHYVSNYDRRIAGKVQDLQGIERVFKSFELSYYLHHDGVGSVNSSNDVKATILGGTAFVFKAYRALQDELKSKQKTPSFKDTFSTNFWRFTDSVLRFFNHGVNDNL